MNAQYNIVFETEDITITSHELFYSETTKFLRAVGSEEQRCVVRQARAVTLCDVFIYDAEAGTGEFFGNPDVAYEGGAQTIIISGSELDFSQQEASGTQLIVGREQLPRRDFEAPDFFEFEAPEGARFSQMTATPGVEEFPREEGPIPVWLLDQNLPRLVSPVSPERPGYVDDDSEIEDLREDIEPEEPLWEKGIDPETGTSTK